MSGFALLTTPSRRFAQGDTFARKATGFELKATLQRDSFSPQGDTFASKATVLAPKATLSGRFHPEPCHKCQPPPGTRARRPFPNPRRWGRNKP